MLQQILALIVICFFLFRLYGQKRKNEISANEFSFWLFFWVFSLIAVVFIKKIDNLVARLGFSASGINVLVYVSIVIIIYQYFRMRLRLEKIERNLTKIVREIAIKQDDR